MRVRDPKKEQKLRDVAVETIVRHGFDGLSMQKLARALKACKKKPKGKRAVCQAQARKKYGAVKSRAEKKSKK